jgi:hypothetical protein
VASPMMSPPPGGALAVILGHEVVGDVAGQRGARTGERGHHDAMAELDGSEIDWREEFPSDGAHVGPRKRCAAVQLMASWRWERLRGLLAERAHVDNEAVLDVAGGDAIESGLNPLDGRECR